MELATLLYAALLVFHPSWQDGFCDEVGETRLAKCEEGVERGQLHLEDFTRVLANECELKEGQGVKLDCLLMGIVAEKESSLGDEAPGKSRLTPMGSANQLTATKGLLPLNPVKGITIANLPQPSCGGVRITGALHATSTLSGKAQRV